VGFPFVFILISPFYLNFVDSVWMNTREYTHRETV